MSHSLPLSLSLSLCFTHFVASTLCAPRILGTLWLNNVIKININDFESRLGIAPPPATPLFLALPLLLTGGPQAAAVTYRDPLKVEAEVETEAEPFLGFVFCCCCCFYCN